MLGLLYKNLVCAGRLSRQVGLIALVFFAMGMLTGFNLAAPMVIMMVSQLGMSVSTYDDQARWPAYAATLPISRAAVVVSHYLFVLLLLIAGMVLGMAVQLAINIARGTAFGQEFTLTLLILGALTLLSTSVMIPLVYRFGTERARIILLLVYVAPFMAILLLLQSGMVSEGALLALAALHPAVLLAAVLPACAAVLALSCAVSIAIYKRKEL